MNSTKIDCLKNIVDKLSVFLYEHRDLVNACIVDFITEDVFRKTLNFNLRNELKSLKEEEIKKLHSLITNPDESSNTLKILLNAIKDLSNEAMQICSSKSIILNFEDTLLHYFDTLMGKKKTHEVTVLSHFINEVCKQEKIESLIDLGSGKGYLSQILSREYGYRVLAVDSSIENTQGAQKREQNLESKWDGLRHRAEVRMKTREEPKSRGKNWMSKLNKSGTKKDEIIKEVRQNDKLKLLTQFIDVNTDILSIIRSNFHELNLSDFGIVGLHTCGNLGPNSIRLFLKNSTAKVLVNVGCCYNHIDEEFYRSPYENDPHKALVPMPGFPMSDFLRNKKFFLGRNARMIAVQSLDRSLAQNPLPSESLLWRAILQTYLIQHHMESDVRTMKVGKIAAKSSDYLDYFKKAMKKLELVQKIPDEEVCKSYDELSAKYKNELNVFYQLRSLFAPLIEELILLDRILFIKERDIPLDVHLIKLFDGVISPRCYAIYARKL